MRQWETITVAFPFTCTATITVAITITSTITSTNTSTITSTGWLDAMALLRRAERQPEQRHRIELHPPGHDGARAFDVDVIGELGDLVAARRPDLGELVGARRLQRGGELAGGELGRG